MKASFLFGMVQDELRAVEAELRSVIHSEVNLVTGIGEHLIQAGGKRLRPALYLICAKTGRAPLESLLPIAVALELIHMATLVHDDVIDSSSTRRGRPTANAIWGNHASVLSGDYFFAKAFSVVAARNNPKVLGILANAVCSMCEGEIIQTQDLFEPDRGEDRYLMRIRMKTADFIAASTQLGGISAELAPGEIEALRYYGDCLGMAFQITDDILDVTASSEQIGKPVGNDLRQGIITLPVIRALQNSPHREELRDIIVSRDISSAKLQKAISIIHDTDAIEYSYARAGDFLQQARSALPAVLNDGVRKTLVSVADFVGLRKF